MRLILALLASLLLLGAGVESARAADTDLQSLEKQVETASTPAQHEAIAKEYQALATKSRERANLHRQMADRYAQGKSVLDQSGHCRSIASREDQNAADYDALAKAHEAEAKK